MIACPFRSEHGTCRHINEAAGRVVQSVKMLNGLTLPFTDDVCQFCVANYPDPATRREGKPVLDWIDLATGAHAQGKCIHLGAFIRSNAAPEKRGCGGCAIYECKAGKGDDGEIQLNVHCGSRCDRYEIEPPPADPADPVDSEPFTVHHDIDKMLKRPIDQPPTPEEAAAIALPPPPKVEGPTKIIFDMHQSLGDAVALTAAIRDLHKAHPGRFATDVRTPFPAVWRHNPYLTAIDDRDHSAYRIKADIPAVHRSNQRGLHLMEAFAEDIAAKLGIAPYPLTEFRGDIHLAPDEVGRMSIPHERYNVHRYWIICSGGKKDFTVKWPNPATLQQVVDHFKGRIQFVQIGLIDEPWHHHPLLENVIDLRGKTNHRDLIRTVHSASGVLCGITCLVHLAAAVPTPRWMPSRACVVVAGGREPRSWYGYKTHRILDTVGAMPCCRTGGCWKSRTVKLHDASPSDGNLCERVVNGFPKCMWSISADDIIRAIDLQLESEQL
jgi:hypothetical protein